MFNICSLARNIVATLSTLSVSLLSGNSSLIFQFEFIAKQKAVPVEQSNISLCRQRKYKFGNNFHLANVVLLPRTTENVYLVKNTGCKSGN